jgi:hypothetical protein
MGIGFHLAAIVVLYRLVRSTLGRMSALVGLLVLVFLPTQFAWSISALKDPLFFLLTAASVVLTTKLIRGPGWKARASSAIAIVLLTLALETIRQAGGLLCAAGVLGGLGVALLVQRPRLLVATAIVLPLAASAALSRPAAYAWRLQGRCRPRRDTLGACRHAGIRATLLDEGLVTPKDIDDLKFGESMRFLERAVERYLTVPWPWEAQSASALVYTPEQIVWYALVVLAPFGLVLAMRRDALVASLLVGHAIVAALTVALSSGNVGTLVRHRGLALPYFTWLSAVAFCDLVVLARRDRAAAPAPSALPVSS